MNDDAVLYVKSNNFQRHTTKKILDEYIKLLNWQEDGSDSVLDIGCGTGDVTVELVLPKLPPQFLRLIGCDLSDRMINYAQHHYNHPKVTFQKLDIREDVTEFLNKFGQFDHIVSFFCLNWVRNKEQALVSIHKLLTGNGDCLLMFVVSTTVHIVYEEISKSEKWAKYMKDIELVVPVHQNINSPVDDFRLLCESVGFTHCDIQIQEPRYVFENYELYKNFYTSINPFVKRIPVSEQDDFIFEILERLITKNEEKNDEKFLVTCKIIIINARK